MQLSSSGLITQAPQLASEGYMGGRLDEVSGWLSVQGGRLEVCGGSFLLYHGLLLHWLPASDAFLT